MIDRDVVVVVAGRNEPLSWPAMMDAATFSPLPSFLSFSMCLFSSFGVVVIPCKQGGFLRSAEHTHGSSWVHGPQHCIRCSMYCLMHVACFGSKRGLFSKHTLNP